MSDTVLTTKQDKNSKGYFQAIGRRKESVAKVRIFPGQGQMTVNGMPISEYFRGAVLQKIYQKPFEMTGTLGKFTATIKIIGGGATGQLDALVHGISRALEQTDKDKVRPVLKKAGFLKRDARAKERRKYGLAHAARAKKNSPKR